MPACEARIYASVACWLNISKEANMDISWHGIIGAGVEEIRKHTMFFTSGSRQGSRVPLTCCEAERQKHQY